MIPKNKTLLLGIPLEGFCYYLFLSGLFNIDVLKLHSINCSYQERERFHLGGISGNLFLSSSANEILHPSSFAKRPDKVESALELCNHPYRLRNESLNPEFDEKTTVRSKSAISIAARLLRLCRFNFFLARAYAGWRGVPVFQNARESIAFFRAHVKGNQSELCLPRALFAAKTSRAFQAEGVVFIGVFLPARTLHAWVVEGDSIADPLDDIWINYQPVAILT